MQLTTDPGWDLGADAAVDGSGVLWVAWFSNRSPPYLQIYTKTHDGSAWGGDTRLPSPFDDQVPGLAYDDSGRLWLVYQSRRVGCLDTAMVDGSYDLCYRTRSGGIWGSPQNLTDTLFDEFGPQVASSPGGELRVVWFSDRWGNADVFAAPLNTGGPGSAVNATPGPQNDEFPDILQDQAGVWLLAWVRQTTGDDSGREIFLKSSNDGLTWNGSEIRVTSDGWADAYPALAQDPQGTYWLAWASYRFGHYDIFVANATTPAGLATATPQRLTTSTNRDFNPGLVVDAAGTLWLFYETGSPGGEDLWYMTRDDAPPRILSAGPSGSVGSSSATLTATTHENAECRYSASSQNYAQMDPARTLGGGGSWSHSATVTASAGENRFYISCRDTAGNPMDNASQVAFTYTPPSSGGGGSGGGGGGGGGGGFVSPSTPASTPKPASTPTPTPTPTPASTSPPAPTATPALASASTPAPEPTLPPLRRESREGSERGVADQMFSGVLGALSSLQGLPPLYLVAVLFAAVVGALVVWRRLRRRPY